MKAERGRTSNRPAVVLGAVFILCGVLSIWESWRITAEFRRPGAFDVLGPDHYFFGLGVLIMLLGIVLIIPGTTGIPVPRKGADMAALPRRTAVVFLAVSVYALAIAVIGYTLATFCFFPAANYLLGIRDWRANLIVSVLTAGLIYVVFIWFADMPLPSGHLLSAVGDLAAAKMPLPT